jgi:hypothetical protein
LPVEVFADRVEAKVERREHGDPQYCGAQERFSRASYGLQLAVSGSRSIAPGAIAFRNDDAI